MDQKEYVSYSVMINGIEVNAVYSRESIDGICLDHSVPQSDPFRIDSKLTGIGDQIPE